MPQIAQISRNSVKTVTSIFRTPENGYRQFSQKVQTTSPMSEKTASENFSPGRLNRFCPSALLVVLVCARATVLVRALHTTRIEGPFAALAHLHRLYK